MVSDVLLFSGGVDSAYLLETVTPEDGIGVALFVDYGQPAAEQERRAVSVMARRSNWMIKTVSIAGMPLGEMAAGVGMHIVPARNVWLISIAAAFGRHVWIGCAPQDREYEDCRLSFLSLMDDALGAIGGQVHWSNTTRDKRVALLKDRDVIQYCWSCYGSGPEPCGECKSCTQ